MGCKESNQTNKQLMIIVALDIDFNQSNTSTMAEIANFYVEIEYLHQGIKNYGNVETTSLENCFQFYS